MKKLAVVLSSILVATSAQASTSSATFYANDNSVETSICIVAANNGYSAARLEAKKQGIQYQSLNFACNGLSVKEFAKTYYVKPQETEKEVVLVPANDSLESQLCIKAANQGINAIGTMAKKLICNGDEVARFVRKVKNS
ncbi:hypothetical protein [Thalassotalea ganghwensis]